jgi:hypothetical protein
MRNINCPENFLANNQLITAILALPRCKFPVGLGANLTTTDKTKTGAFKYQGNINICCF